MVVRMDNRMDSKQQKLIREAIHNGKVFVAEPIDVPSTNGWREEMLRELDDVKPDLVLTPDCDEEFGPGIKNDLVRLWNTDVCGLMFGYRMEPANAVHYPADRQMKAFKWLPGLTYYLKRSKLCIPGDYMCNKRHPKMRAKSTLVHYYALTDEKALKKKGPTTITITASGESVTKCVQDLKRQISKYPK